MGTQSGTFPDGLRQDRDGDGRWRLLVTAVLLAGVWSGWLVPVQSQAVPASSVPLLLPTTVVFDGAGTMYVAETNRHVVDRIDALGRLTVVAGSGAQGFSGDGGAATSAQLDSPQGLAVDAAGNLYIADTRNHRVRLVAAGTGTISTIAGTGTPGFFGDGGPGLAARLNMPVALALDGAGNLEIADANNHRVRQLTLTSGILRTVAGNGTQGDAGDGGPALSASIDTPTGIAVDANGNLYLSDTHNHRVRRVAQDTGTILTVATPVVANATAFRLLLPRGLTFDLAGSLYIADAGAHRVLRVAADGTTTAVAGGGTQGFAGDGGDATAALLDRPRAAAISPSGLVAIADTGNQRIRQFAADGTILTFGGVEPPGQTSLSISAPMAVLYGAGIATASLISATGASGVVSFFEQSNGLLTQLGTTALSGNTAALSTAMLPVGVHHLLATYAGDATHLAAQSQVLAVTISPVDVAASASSATIFYGQAIPAFVGSLVGVLPRDAGLVAAVLATSAEALSPAGMYPIVATLTGPAAGNYRVVQTAGAFLTIAQAASATSLATSTPSAMQGSTVTLQARATSTTQGVPTGRMTFLDSGTAIGSSALDPTGAASVAASLSVGTHTVTAVYSGDANFRPSTSSAVSAVIAGTGPAAPDFSVSVSGASSQTAAAGGSVTYPFLVTVQNGPLNSPILLTASGVPPGATTTFSPNYVPPGGTSSAFTFTVQTGKASAFLRPLRRPIWAMLLWGSCTLFPFALRRRRLRSVMGLMLLGSVCGCGDRITALPAATGASAKVYPLVVTATSTAASGAVLQHTVSVTLTVQ